MANDDCKLAIVQLAIDAMTIDAMAIDAMAIGDWLSAVGSQLSVLS
jgi:hypothetical protein